MMVVPQTVGRPGLATLFALEHRHCVLEQWKGVVQVLLHHLDKLRVIQLIEADLNMYSKCQWGCQMTRQAHSLRLNYTSTVWVRPCSMAMSDLL